jgi:hypothetical protein
MDIGCIRCSWPTALAMPRVKRQPPIAIISRTPETKICADANRNEVKDSGGVYCNKCKFTEFVRRKRY